MKQGFVYILTNHRNGTLYVGVTYNLQQRLYQHRLRCTKKSFVYKYELRMLVYYEVHPTMLDAIKREKQLKKYRRAWKLELIEKMNPGWQDLTSLILRF